ncbi:prepilin-type N-terminal cleavage/methylation domain-containing protein [Neptunomonas marina]|uniref:Prepilin-type N-terminal cleavage/methylation domain-containing protein n=1 Tax=Neptunomonas marina TaxID=1815562 RepID=A0A437Q590_9GAMM|nr:prepilin-type N-terminal cleavage/methylation domain-containing protein [Neptunomonas marina]RVU29676.1 prepilin-type N-terminal cleavage/methylation domain-containing protein [Neptunomonas marina]
MRRGQLGFTLVELVVVIVLLGIISLGATGFIVSSVQGYADMARRDGMAGASRVAIDRIIREVRNALPNSARVSGQCLEFIPINNATQYLMAPTATPANTFNVVPFSETPDALGSVAIYPISTAAIYQGGSPAVISPAITSAASDLTGNAPVALSLASAHQFPTDSPSQRMYIVGGPISYCFQGDRLYRYTGYSRRSVQPLPAQLPTAEPSRALLAFPVTHDGQPFELIGASLQRNALVMVEFAVEQGGEALRIQQEVQIRNVP